MDRVPKRAASLTLSESSKESSPEFSATRANMTSTCAVHDDETDDLPVTETTHGLLEDRASDHSLTDLVFELMQAAMSDGAEGVDGASALGLPVSL